MQNGNSGAEGPAEDFRTGRGSDNMKKITAMLLAVVLMLSAQTGAAAADDEEQGSCVTLLAGEGTGEKILLDSGDADTMAESWEEALPGMFLKEEKQLYFRIPPVPGDYEAPDETRFAGWALGPVEEESDGEPEIVQPGFWLESGEDRTLTAIWLSLIHI